MPLAIPVTIPEVEPMLPVPGALLLQVPPVTASLKVVVEPMHTDATPAMAAGASVTVTINVAGVPQPVV